MRSGEGGGRRSYRPEIEREKSYFNRLLMAQAGKIPARRVGKLWRFSADRLREWVDQAS
jgi:excisionase family DNA binding protein